MTFPSAIATIHTNHGDIVVNLFGDHAPRTVANFIGLADGTGEWTHPTTGEPGEGALYRDVIFHRIIPGFMIQGGDPLGQGIGGPGYTFNDEIHPELHFDQPYKLAMANAGQRPNPATGEVEGTNGSQFFITTDPTPWLDGKHTIFGEVVDADSRQVIDVIAAVPTARGDKPIDPVIISSIDITDA